MIGQLTLPMKLITEVREKKTVCFGRVEKVHFANGERGFYFQRTKMRRWFARAREKGRKDW